MNKLMLIISGLFLLLIVYVSGFYIGYYHRGSDMYLYAYKEVKRNITDCYYGKVDCKIEGFDEFVFRPQADFKAVKISMVGAGDNTMKRRGRR